MTRVASLFSTPVFTARLPDAATLSAALRESVLARHAAQPGVSRSNVGGWQSDIDMLAWGGNAARALADRVADICRSVTVPEEGAAPIMWRPEIWANVNRSGESNQSHWHPGSYLSFVYYVDDGYAGSTDPALGGELVFIDPRMPFLRMRTPNLRHRNAAGTIDEHETWVRPFSGLLIGFPSFLAHSVRPYFGPATRISIAINMIVRPA